MTFTARFHGHLEGLGNDDHTIYALASGSRGPFFWEQVYSSSYMRTKSARHLLPFSNAAQDIGQADGEWRGLHLRNNSGNAGSITLATAGGNTCFNVNVDNDNVWGYINFSSTSGSSGYGLRDNGGTIQYKNSGGSWTNISDPGTAFWTHSSTNLYPVTAGDAVQIRDTGASVVMQLYPDSVNSIYYLNFGATQGSGGYGVRDNGGTVEYKNYEGAWTAIASGTVSGTPNPLTNDDFHVQNGYGIRLYSDAGSTLTAYIDGDSGTFYPQRIECVTTNATNSLWMFNESTSYLAYCAKFKCSGGFVCSIESSKDGTGIGCFITSSTLTDGSFLSMAQDTVTFAGNSISISMGVSGAFTGNFLSFANGGTSVYSMDHHGGIIQTFNNTSGTVYQLDTPNGYSGSILLLRNNTNNLFDFDSQGTATIYYKGTTGANGGLRISTGSVTSGSLLTIYHSSSAITSNTFPLIDLSLGQAGGSVSTTAAKVFRYLRGSQEEMSWVHLDAGTGYPDCGTFAVKLLYKNMLLLGYNSLYQSGLWVDSSNVLNINSSGAIYFRQYGEIIMEITPQGNLEMMDGDVNIDNGELAIGVQHLTEALLEDLLALLD